MEVTHENRKADGPSLYRRAGAAIRRTLSLMAVSALAVALMLGGCGPAMTRPQRYASRIS